MLSFLKVFVRGIVCTVLLPLILVVWVLYGVYCLIAFLVMLVKSIVVFFAGGSAAGEMKEDIEAKRILLEAEQAKVEQAQVMNMMYQNMAAQQQMMQQQMMQQNMPQPAVMPAPDVAPQPQPAQFDSTNLEPAQEEPSNEGVLENDQPANEEGGNNNDQSY